MHAGCRCPVLAAPTAPAPREGEGAWVREKMGAQTPGLQLQNLRQTYVLGIKQTILPDVLFRRARAAMAALSPRRRMELEQQERIRQENAEYTRRKAEAAEAARQRTEEIKYAAAMKRQALANKMEERRAAKAAEQERIRQQNIENKRRRDAAQHATSWAAQEQKRKGRVIIGAIIRPPASDEL